MGVTNLKQIKLKGLFQKLMLLMIVCLIGMIDTILNTVLILWKKKPILYLRKYGIIFIPDLILTIVFYIYSCTELPKRNRFISFFIKIFIAIAESPIPGAMISWMYMNSQAGFKCHLSWGILKWTLSVKILHIFFLIGICNNSYPFM